MKKQAFAGFLFLWAAGGAAWGAVYTVTNAADAGAGTLRAAITAANANPGADTIEFDLPSGSRTITVSTDLPRITDPVFVDGTSQPGYTKAPLVSLTASAALTNGLALYANSSTVSALRVYGFESGILARSNSCVVRICYVFSNWVEGIAVRAGGCRVLDNYVSQNQVGISVELGRTNSILGNWVGIHPSTGIAYGNYRGIMVSSDHNFIGGTGEGDGNVVSGNDWKGIQVGGQSNTVRGNLVGTDAGGTAAVPNDEGVVIDGENNTIGGSKAGSRNVISGNTGYGIKLAATDGPVTGNAIEGNYIGTDISGSNALPNGVGVLLLNSQCRSNTIGGALSLSRNIISGNDGNGVEVNSAPFNIIQGNHIGTDVSGRFDLGNDGHGVYVFGAGYTMVGGASAGEGNLISGNDEHGVMFFGRQCDESRVQGNKIGTDVAGTQALANALSGIMVSGSEKLTLGGIGSDARNVVSGNHERGIYIADTNSHEVVVQGNYVGTDVTGQKALANGQDGIYLNGACSNLIGGVALSAGNVVAGNYGNGITVYGATAVSNVIQSNYIGVDADGEDPLPNLGAGLLLDRVLRCRVGNDFLVGGGNLISGNEGRGIWLFSSSRCEILGNRIGGHIVGPGFGGNEDTGLYFNDTSSSNTIGGDVWTEANIITWNGGPGIHVAGTNCVGNRIDYNMIFDNDGMGIDLGELGHTPNDTMIGGDPDDGANNLQNYPTITNVFVDGANLRIQGYLRSGIGEAYKLNFYGNTMFDPSGYGEGEIILGTTNGFTSPLDQFNFDATVPKPAPTPDYYTATATHTLSGDTSEHSHFAMLDSDGDGMPDGWETRHFGSPTGGDPAGNADGDPFLNLDEFNADTDPTNGVSRLEIVAMRTLSATTQAVAVVGFPSSAYRIYRLEHAEGTAVLSNDWVAGFLGYQTGTGTNMTSFDLLPALPNAALYRVRGRLP